MSSLEGTSPTGAIIQAFQVLVKQILSESGERITLWKDNLLNALGDNGKSSPM